MFINKLNSCTPIHFRKTIASQIMDILIYTDELKFLQYYISNYIISQRKMYH